MSRRRWAAAGLVACAVLVLAGGCTSGGRDDTGPRPGGGGDGSGWGCPSDVDLSVPDSPPEGVAWEPLSDEVPVLLPVSTRYGPCRVDTTASGYARTPRGAVVAAAQLLARASTPGPVGEDTIEGQVVPGPWRDKLFDSLDDGPAGSPVSVPVLAGFSVAGWDRDAARVAIAARYNHLPGQFLVLSVDLAWRGGDWWLHPPPAGDWSNAVTVRASLPTEFVPWGPA
jgi:hypothetical protein